MKFNFLKASFFTLAIILIAAACTKDDENTADNLKLGELIATIDGEEFKSVGISGLIYESDTFNYQELTITAIKNIGTSESAQVVISIGLPLTETLTTTTYNHSGFPSDECDNGEVICSFIAYSTDDSANPDNNIFSLSFGTEASSSITFSTLDYRKGGTAKGTFSGTLTKIDGSTFTLTDGSFYVNIQ